MGDPLAASASLLQRIAGMSGFTRTSVAEPTSAHTARRLRHWHAVVGGLSSAHFDRRLRYLGIDRASAVVALDGHVPLSAFADVPWAQYVPMEAHGASGGDPEATNRSVLAVADQARRRLCERAGDLGALLADPAYQDLHAALIGRLRAANRGIERTAQTEASPQPAYPALLRLWGTLAADWVEASLELLTRLSNDAALLSEQGAEFPLLVTDIVGGLSDYHGQGRSVQLLTFRNGVQLLYKPRSLRIDRALAKLLLWLDERGADTGPAVPEALDRGAYGWASPVRAAAPASAGEASRYYQRLGSLLGVLHALGSVDMHCDNVIASGDTPVLVDVETVLQPTLYWDDETLDDLRSLRAQLHSGVLDTGVLPRWEERGGALVDDSALCGPVVAGVHSLQPASRPGLELFSVVQQPLSHEVIAACLSDGFTRMYQTLVRNRPQLLADGSPLLALAQCEVRVLVRPTQTYAALLDHLAAPRYLHNGIDRGIALESLLRPFAQMSAAGAGGDQWPFAVGDFEIDCLARADIPALRMPADSTRLPLGSRCLDEAVLTSPLSRAVGRLDALNDGDLRVQQRLLGEAIGTRWEDPGADVASLGGGRQGLTDGPTQTAAMVAGALLDAAWDDGSERYWVGRAPVAGSGHHRLEPSGDALYDGVAGVAVFLLAAGSIASTQQGDQLHLRRAALTVLRQLSRSWQSPRRLRSKALPVAGLAGAAGIYWAWVAGGQLAHDEELVEQAVRAVHSVDPDDLLVGPVDVVDGAAGAILCLLSAYDLAGSAPFRELALAVSDALAAAWMASAPGLRTAGAGLAHGLPGVAMALARAYRAGGGRHLAGAALEAWAAAGTQPRKRSEASRGWCAGAAGTLLGGLELLRITPSRLVEADVARAVDELVCAAPTPGSTTLCCGLAGEATALLAAADRLAAPELADEALDMARRLPAPAHTAPAGLFDGAAGVGWVLLEAGSAGMPSASPPLLPIHPGR